MINFVGVEVKDHATYKHQKFAFTPGIHTIYGMNRTLGPRSKNANMVGKSALFSQVQEVIYDMPVLGSKEDRVRTGERRLVLRNNDGKKVEISRNGAKIDVNVDGKNVADRVTAAKEKIEDLIPLTEDEFSTYVYYDARRPHPLVMGSSAQRKSFFVSFFQLDRMDEERKLFQAELKKLGKIRAAYEELQGAYQQQSSVMIGQDEIEKLRERHQKGALLLKKLRRTVDSGDEATRILMFLEHSGKQIEHYRSVASALDIDLDKFGSVLEQHKDALKQKKIKLRKAREYEDYLDKERKYTELTDALSKASRSLLSEHGLEKAVELAKSRGSKLREMQDQLEDLDVPKPGKKPTLVPRPKVDEAKLLVQRKTLKHQLEHAQKFGKGACPTCGQDVKVKNPSELKKSLDLVEELLKNHQESEESELALEDYKKRVEKFETSESKKAELEQKIKKYLPYKNCYKELSILPEKPEPVEKVLGLKKWEFLVKEYESKLESLEWLSDNRESLQLALNADPEKLKATVELTKTQASKFADVQQRLAGIEAKLELAITVRKSLTKTKERIDDLKAQLEDEETLKMLVAAYSDKGMKKMAVDAISRHLVKQLNQYAKLVFPADYKFEFFWDNTKVRFIAHRRSGRRMLTSDVRKLSGAESALFTFILIMSLLAFVPPSRRSNLLILDEPTASMSEEMIDTFRELLPSLNRLIPCLVIITPKIEQRFGGKEYTVIKDNTGARMVTGHPSEH